MQMKKYIFISLVFCSFSVILIYQFYFLETKQTKVDHTAELRRNPVLLDLMKNISVIVSESEKQKLSTVAPTKSSSSVILPDEWQSNIVLDTVAECPSAARIKNVSDKDTRSCRIPELDPFHPSIMKFITKTADPYCPGVTYGRIWNGKLEFTDPNVVSASYRPILRSGDFKYTLGPVVNYKSGDYINDEMLEVTYNLKYGGNKTDFLLQISSQNPQRQYINKANLIKTPGMPLNILVLGIDSLSLANTPRKLPEIYKFLKEHDAVFFTGHTIAGDGTTPQLTAMLTGKHVEEQYEARTGKPGAKPIDEWTWIFKQLKEHGYLTGFSEDGIWDGPFQYRLLGWKDPPTDFYPRPFFLDIAARTKYPTDRCINNRNVPEIHWEYVSTVFNSYPKRLKFYLSFNAGYSHHEMNWVQKNEKYVMKILKDLKQSGQLDNTLLMILGDHGIRWGKVRTTVQGKLEERLPLFSIVTPPGFAAKYPAAMANLKVNTGRLTSWFDVYATFRHMLSYPDPPTGLTRGQSLFTEVPKARSCKDIGTAEHWCPCLEWMDVDVKHPHIQTAALAAVEFINDLLSKDKRSLEKCAKLTLKEINFAQLERPNEAVVKTHLGRGATFKQSEEYFCRYQLQFVTSPNEGLFEATVKYHKRRFVVGTGISRINQYGEQPACVAANLPHVRKYCLCKDYKGSLT